MIGTLWPDLYAAYTAVPIPGGADPHPREREVLELAVVVRIDAAFSVAEQARARAAAVRDRRLRVALGAAGYGLTQPLAAAPQLVARWQDARTVSPYGWAVLTAALDVARLGARAPLSIDLLRAAAPGYCTSQQQAEAPENWFEQALAYATTKLHGAVAALTPVGNRMGQVTGYTIADYLIQQASRERRYVHVPISTWDAVLTHIRDPADTTRLGDSALNRLLHCYAIPLYRRAADSGDREGTERLAWLLAERGDLDGAAHILRSGADAGDQAAARRLAGLLAQRGDVEGLRARADAGDQDAAQVLANLLAERHAPDGAVQILRVRAEVGDRDAAARLADLLAQRGDMDRLRALADAGDQDAAQVLTGLLSQRGDVDGVRARAEVGDQDAAQMLAGLLIKQDQREEAERLGRFGLNPDGSIANA